MSKINVMFLCYLSHLFLLLLRVSSYIPIIRRKIPNILRKTSVDMETAAFAPRKAPIAPDKKI